MKTLLPHPLDPATCSVAEMERLIQQSGLRHVAIIMDGNRRWAETRGLPKVMGHPQGVEALKTLVRYAGEIGLEALTVYAFSTENWRRGEEEVGTLMTLFAQALGQELENLHRNGVRLRFIGDLTQLAPPLQAQLQKAMLRTAENTGLQFQVATNYGSRAELIRAVQQLAHRVEQGEMSAADITEALLQQELYTADLPDPDLLIRTGGEHRWSNFLLWQCAYSEFYVTDTYWPDFTPTELNRALLDFSNRQRRYGK